MVALCALLGVLAGLCHAPAVCFCLPACISLCGGGAVRGPRYRPCLLCCPRLLDLAFIFAELPQYMGGGTSTRYTHGDNWNQKLGLFTNTVAPPGLHGAVVDSSPKAPFALCLTAVLCLLTNFGTAVCHGRRLPAHWLGFGLAYFAVTMGATWLISAPRYAVGLFCPPIALALLLQAAHGSQRVYW